MLSRQTITEMQTSFKIDPVDINDIIISKMFAIQDIIAQRYTQFYAIRPSGCEIFKTKQYGSGFIGPPCTTHVVRTWKTYTYIQCPL